MRPILAAVPAMFVIIALAGCATVEVEPSASPTASPTAEASPSPSPDPTPEPFTISECETMLPLIVAQEFFAPSVEFRGEVTASDVDLTMEMPEVGAALSAASQSRVCQWAVPNSDGGFRLVVAELDEASRDVLLVALPAAGFASSTDGLTTTLKLEQEGEFFNNADTHILTGGVWILVSSQGLEVTEKVSSFALDVLRAANPTLDF